MNFVKHINISGNGDDKLMVYQPRGKFFYWHIDSEAFTQAIRTCRGSEYTERFKFTMKCAVLQADVNWEEVGKNIEKLYKVSKNLGNEYLDLYVAWRTQVSFLRWDGRKQGRISAPGPVDPS